MIITKSPFAEMFPRLFELKDADPNPTHPDTYLQHLEERLENEHIRFVYGKMECTLSVLDAEAWRDLKERALPLLKIRFAQTPNVCASAAAAHDRRPGRLQAPARRQLT